MQSIKWSKFAPVGLYLSLAGALSAAGFYIVKRSMSLPLQISLGFMVAGLALYAILNPDGVRRALTGRQARYGSNIFVLTIAVVGIIVVINYLGYKNSKRWDLTETQVHTLAQETIDTLNSLPEKVTAQAFFTSRYPKDSAERLLKNYQYAGNGKFDYQFIDPEANPLAAQSAKVSRDATIVLKMGDRQEQVTYASEQEITSAMIRLANPGERSVYFLTGHGESDIENSGETSYTQVRQLLANKNYTIKTLNTLSNPAIPEEANVVVIAGPKKPLSNQEVEAIQTYLENGGSLVLLSEPQELTYQNQEDPLAGYLKAQWGVSLVNDIVIDPNVNPPLIAIADKYGQHPITEKLMNMATLFPTAHSIAVDQNDGQVTITPLITTSQQTWGETDFADLQNNTANPDKGIDSIGPLTIAITGLNSTTKSRLVVVADADFASDSYFQQYGNADLFINSIDWAAEQENLISLTPKNQVSRFLMTPKQYTLGLILLGFVFVLPASVVVSGVAAWASRRRRG